MFNDIRVILRPKRLFALLSDSLLGAGLVVTLNKNKDQIIDIGLRWSGE